MKALLGASLSAAFLLVSVTSADAEPRRGRMPDGRAYRIDHQGLRLIDQIAELEVSNDDMRRQILKLEDQLEQKERASTERTVAENRGAEVKPRPSNIAEMQALVARVTSLEAELEAERKKKPVVTEADCDYQSPENPLWSRVTKLEEQLTLQRGPQAAEYRAEVDKREALEIENARLTKLLAEKEQRSEELVAMQEDLVDRVVEERAQQRASMAAETRPQTIGQRVSPAVEAEASVEASARMTADEPMPPPSVLENTPQIAPAAEEQFDVASTQEQLRNQIAEVQKKINRRKDLLDALKRKGKGVSISIQRVASKRGTSLDSVRMQVATVATARGATELRSDLSEIAAVIDEDIKLLERLVTVHGF